MAKDRVIPIEDDQELFKRQYLWLKHYEEGNLLNIRMFKYHVMQGEKNVTYVEDQMSLRRKTKKDKVVEMGDMLTLFTCNKCNKSFELISSLAVHKRRCQEEDQEEDESNEEKKKDEGNKEIKCRLCGKVYLSKGVRIHLEMECDRGLPTNICIYCREVFCVAAIRDWHVENNCDLAKERREKEEQEKMRVKEEEKRKGAQEAEKKAAEEEAQRKEEEKKVAEEAEKKVKEEEDKRKEEEKKAAEEMKVREAVERAKEAVREAARKAAQEAEKKAKEEEAKRKEAE